MQHKMFRSGHDLDLDQMNVTPFLSQKLLVENIFRKIVFLQFLLSGGLDDLK